MTRQVELPAALADAIRAQARAASPYGCCGLLEGLRVEGVRGDRAFKVKALHPVRNLSSEPARFEMEPQGQFAAHRAARANGAAIIGCYHSHPYGPALPSAADRAGAGEENFLWLIAGDEGLNAFVYSDREFFGADWVTSSE
jgi:proteasome lid subunit RPN8/RPN11